MPLCFRMLVNNFFICCKVVDLFLCRVCQAVWDDTGLILEVVVSVLWSTNSLPCAITYLSSSFSLSAEMLPDTISAETATQS
jgi:hypothetical protein